MSADLTPGAPRPRLIDVLAGHDGVLLDAYGVLVDASGVLPGAVELIAHLDAGAVPHAVVTNDASRAPATIARRLAGYGLPIPAERIFTSGMLLTAALRARDLAGAAVCVLGPAEAADYAHAAGATTVAARPGMHLDVLTLSDDAGYDFLPALEAVLSALVRAVDAGRQPVLLLPNPDLVYPKSPDELGFTAGAAALMLEAALARRFGPRAPRFVRLGKPQPDLLHLAAGALSSQRPVMVGDQLETDIAAAAAAGMAGALIEGVSRWRSDPDLPRPTYLLSGL